MFTPSTQKATDSQIMKMLVCQILLVLWHGSNNPVWITFLAPAFCIWRAFIIKGKRRLPPGWITTVLSLMAFTGVFLQFGAIMARDPGLSALTILSSAKMLEMRNRRDYIVSLYLCYFLVFAQFLFNDTILTLLTTMFFTLYLTSLLITVNSGDKRSIFPFIKKAVLFQAAGLPFVLLLFFFFPRTSFSILSFENKSNKGISGLSSTLQPGAIADLVKDGSTAFRVTFKNYTPSNSELYFRGLVMWFTDGEKWYSKVVTRPFRRRRVRRNPEMRLIEQEILLEPHYNNWVFGLDHPIFFSQRFYEKPGYVFITGKVVSQKKYNAYSVISPIKKEDIIDTEELGWSLQLPDSLDPRIRELAERIAIGATTTREKATALMNFFRNGGFEYSLTPGEMKGKNWAYEFLTDRKKGFCSHFATSFVLLARALNLPSRVVTGFQGADLNPVGGYYIVRNSHAHAWCEVYLDDNKWVRLDPTAAAAPYRIRGTDENAESDAGGNRNKGFFGSIGQYFENHWDNLNSMWYRWVIGFDNFQQREFLRMLDLDHSGILKRIGEVAVAGCIMLIIVFILMKPKVGNQEILNRIYERYQRKLKRRGVIKSSWEGPVDLKNRYIEEAGGKYSTKGVVRFTDIYCQIQYGKLRISNRNLSKLRKELRRL